MHLIWQSSLFWRTAPQVRTVTALSYLKVSCYWKRAILAHTWSSSEGIFAPTKVMFTQPLRLGARRRICCPIQQRLDGLVGGGLQTAPTACSRMGVGLNALCGMRSFYVSELPAPDCGAASYAGLRLTGYGLSVLGNGQRATCTCHGLLLLHETRSQASLWPAAQAAMRTASGGERSP